MTMQETAPIVPKIGVDGCIPYDSDTYQYGETPPLEFFDYDTILDLIVWAEVSHHVTEHGGTMPEKYATWGEWDQGEWARKITDKSHQKQRDYCGSAFCMAGQVTWQNNLRPLFDSEHEDATARQCVAEQLVTLETGKKQWVDIPNAPHYQIEEAAQVLLGLSTLEASRFFSGSNTVENLQEYFNGMCRARHLPLPYPDAAVYNFENEDLFEE